MRLVVLESPYAGNVEENLAYARRCVHDCLLRGESCVASHLLFTQPGVLDDNHPEERKLGIAAGHEWYRVAEAAVVYTDRGISPGMDAGIKIATERGIPVEFRSLGKVDTSDIPEASEEWFKNAKLKLPEHKFKVGQLWRDGYGVIVRITKIANNPHDYRWLTARIAEDERGVPFEEGPIQTYGPDGHYSPVMETRRDLVELIKDVP